jgi:putative membrane protein
MSETIKKTSDMLAQDRTDLAIERTSMAIDRTLMAWTRTALSMISFGFTVYKFMQYMQQEGKAVLIKTEQGAQNFGKALIALGIISLVVACVQYWQLEKKLNLGLKWYTNLTFISAGFIGLLGLLALANAIFRIGPF